MRILWISLADLHQAGDHVDSINATARYRMLLPAQQLERLGHRVQMLNPRVSMQLATDALVRADTVVFSKLLSDPAGSYEPAIRYYGELLRRIGPIRVRVVLDVNDDHFDVPAFREFYAAQTPLAWVTSSEELARLLRAFTATPPAIIPDPYEGPGGEPTPILPTRHARLFHFLDRLISSPQEHWRVSLLWFGHPAGLPQLHQAIPELQAAGRRFPLHLHCLTAPGYGAEELCGQNARPGASLTMSFEAWSKEATWRALRGCNMVLLPADLRSRKTLVKSANRLVEAIRAGRLAVAHPLPAYRAFADYAYVGDSLTQGIIWAVQHPKQVVERLAKGKDYVATHFSPEAVAQQWLGVLRG